MFGLWLEVNVFLLLIGVKTTALPINQQGLQISESLCLVYTTDVDSSSAGFHNVRQNSIFQMQKGIRDLY